MRPPILCKLKTGLLIDADDHRGFVDTFNWIVDFCNNLCGEGDLDSTKSIRLDRHIDDRPVIRGGAGGGSVSVGSDGPFAPVFEEDSETGEPTDVVSGFTNCYWQKGGKTYLLGDQTLGASNGFVCLKAGTTTTTAGTASLAYYGGLGALQAAQADPEFFIVPLYFLVDMKITIDLRRMPVVFDTERL